MRSRRAQQISSPPLRSLTQVCPSPHGGPLQHGAAAEGGQPGVSASARTGADGCTHQSIARSSACRGTSMEQHPRARAHGHCTRGHRHCSSGCSVEGSFDELRTAIGCHLVAERRRDARGPGRAARDWGASDRLGPVTARRIGRAAGEAFRVRATCSNCNEQL